MHPIRVKLKKPDFWPKIWQSIKVITFLSFTLFRSILRENAKSDKRISTKRQIFWYPTCPISTTKNVPPIKQLFPNLQTLTDLRKWTVHFKKILNYYKWFLHAPWAHATWASLKFSKKLNWSTLLYSKHLAVLRTTYMHP